MKRLRKKHNLNKKWFFFYHYCSKCLFFFLYWYCSKTRYSCFFLATYVASGNKWQHHLEAEQSIRDSSEVGTALCKRKRTSFSRGTALQVFSSRGHLPLKNWRLRKIRRKELLKQTNGWTGKTEEYRNAVCTRESFWVRRDHRWFSSILFLEIRDDYKTVLHI